MLGLPPRRSRMEYHQSNNGSRLGLGSVRLKDHMSLGRLARKTEAGKAILDFLTNRDKHLARAPAAPATAFLLRFDFRIESSWRYPAHLASARGVFREPHHFQLSFS